MVALTPCAVRADDIQKRFEAGGRDRTYLLHLPPHRDARQKLALVIVLHGGAGDGKGAAKQTHFSDVADKHGFIVAYPDGTDRAHPIMKALGKAGFLTWNAGGCCGYAMDNNIDDVTFLRAVVTQIETIYPVDTRRVYATGISNGAMMAYRLACETSDTFAAVGIVAGVVLSQPCAPRQPVSVIDIHGTEDHNVPIKGGVGEKAFTKTNYPPLQDSISLWVNADKCQNGPTTSQPMKSVTLSDYADCRAGTEVALYLIEGGGHSWPGGDRMAKFLDPPSMAMDASEIIWKFFAAHPKS